MLNINKISMDDAYMEGWRKARLGKLTASTNYKLISEDSHKGKLTAGAITHIEGIAGEIITGQPAKREFFNEDVNYGNAMEAEAVADFEKATGRVVFRDPNRGDTHRLIIHDEYSACTPDALVCLAPLESIFDETGEKLKVATFETKCPPIHHRFIKLYKCTTPEMLKAAQKEYYWQVLTQMHHCDSLMGFFSCYNPSFPNPRRIITFKKSLLVDDFKKLNDTLYYAKQELIKTVELLKN